MKIVSVVGARPQFVKAAVLRKLFLENGINEILVHTGQHYDHNMSTVFFEEMDIKTADYFCSLDKRSHGGMTGEILENVEEILKKEQPDFCLVYGDTNSTIAAALAASKLHIPVVHVEAGLRSFNKKMPEEINRILTDHVSKILFCSTSEAIKNLTNENVKDGVFLVGDIMYDAVKLFASTLDVKNIVSELIKRDEKKLACMTLHRQENVVDPELLKEIIEFCRSFQDEYQIIFPIHPNTENKLQTFGINLEGLTIIKPLPYLAMQALVSSSDLMLTDSGGLQKEAYFHQTRCITLRKETEWIETIESGWNRLWSSDDYMQDPIPIKEYGNGNSGLKMINVLKNYHKA